MAEALGQRRYPEGPARARWDQALNFAKDTAKHGGSGTRAVYEGSVELLVRWSMERDATCRSAIPPRAPGLLVVGFKRSRDLPVNDQSDVRLVDS
jgi:hypothetical protein